MNRFVATAHAAAALLQRIPLETREARLMNYVEHIIATICDIDSVGAYLKHCIS